MLFASAGLAVIAITANIAAKTRIGFSPINQGGYSAGVVVDSIQ
jgi:hypothetical protein